MLRVVGSSLPRRLPPLLPRAISPTLSRRRALLLLLSSSFGFGAPSCCRGSSLAHSYASMAAPPVAKKVPLELVDHGDVRVDNYYWLRDDSRSDPDVLAHLRAENDYTAAVMSDVKQLEDEIYAEIRGRIKEDDIDAPLRKGHYYYYERTLAGKEYAQHCRRLVPTNAPITVNDVMPTGPDAPVEHIILDENVKAEGHDYYSIGAFKDIQLFDNHISVYERENGLPKVTVYRLPAIGESIGQLQGGRTIDFIDPTYAVDPEESQFHSTVLRFHYSSMRTPPSVYDYDMDSGVSVLKKIEPVLGGFDASNYVTERKWAAAADGTQIPMSILYRKDLVKLDGSDPLLLYGYGSYEICIDPSFRGSRFSLVDRGFIYVIAHIRGGGEMGRKWYEDGKLLKKKNTFTDFIDCAEHLIRNKYCSKEKLCINGRSAGGLLMGAVLNMRPDLFKAAVAGVPFVDVVTTMLDPTIPLTTAEWEEWGDPRKEEYYYYMKSYSPVDNVAAQGYPNILVTAGLNDPRVMYSEPAKYVAKLRELKTDGNLLLFKCELGAGHFSKSGRFEKLQEDAFTYAFILKALGV
ncbi:protease 2-like [Panicum miliaceum]|uniref:Prolyl endopeptidase n=1 Tax=Panicum miliaceum TaxID=4540 RepID=A0A3L6PEV0_PANMI|nr:protease 2-like [Panicum miliaceum]